MLTLHDLQAGFVSDLVQDELKLLRGTIKPEKFSADALLQVYRNNYFISLTDALRAVYRSVDKLTGKGFFDYIAHEYIVKHPSTDGNLHEFGNAFPRFLKSVPQLEKHAYLPDIAALDWLWHCVFHAADARQIDASLLNRFNPEEYGRLNFQLLPSLRFLNSDFSIFHIWQYCTDENNTGDEDVTLNSECGPEFIILFRSELEVVIYSISPGEYYFLQALNDGRQLEFATSVAFEHDKEFDLPAVLNNNFARALFTDVSVN